MGGLNILDRSSKDLSLCLCSFQVRTFCLMALAALSLTAGAKLTKCSPLLFFDNLGRNVKPRKSNLIIG